MTIEDCLEKGKRSVREGGVHPPDTGSYYFFVGGHIYDMKKALRRALEAGLRPPAHIKRQIKLIDLDARNALLRVLLIDDYLTQIRFNNPYEGLNKTLVNRLIEAVTAKHIPKATAQTVVNYILANPATFAAAMELAGVDELKQTL